MSHFSPICPPFLHHFPPFFFLVGTVSYIFHDVFVTTSHFPPFFSISPHFPPFPPIFPHFSSFSPIFPHFSSFSPIFPIFPWPAGYWDTPDMDTSWACKRYPTPPHPGTREGKGFVPPSMPLHFVALGFAVPWPAHLHALGTVGDCCWIPEPWPLQPATDGKLSKPGHG